MRRTYDVNSLDGKRKYVINAIKVIRESSSPAEQEDLLKTVRDVSGTSLETLKRELYSQDVDKPKSESERTPLYADNSGDKTAMASRFVLASYLFNKPYALEYDIRALDFDLPVHKAIKDFIVERLDAGQTIRFNDLYELFNQDYSQEIAKIAGLEVEENKKFDQTAYFFDCVKTIKLEKLTHDIDRLTSLFEEETDNQKRQTYVVEMAKLVAEKNKLAK